MDAVARRGEETARPIVIGDDVWIGGGAIVLAGVTIGPWGLGLIADAEAVLWSCDGSPNFSLQASERSEPGTDVILHLMEEELEYIEPARIRRAGFPYHIVLLQLEHDASFRAHSPAFANEPLHLVGRRDRSAATLAALGGDGRICLSAEGRF